MDEEKVVSTEFTVEPAPKKKGLSGATITNIALCFCLMVLCSFWIMGMSGSIISGMAEDSTAAIEDIQKAVNERYALLSDLKKTDDRVDALEKEIEELRQELADMQRKEQERQDAEKTDTEKASEYVIQSGDTLCWIAQDMLVGVDKLAGYNNIPDADLIYTGNKLRVPKMEGTVHWVDWGETIYSIADLYGVTAEEIAEYNEIRNWNLLYVDTPIIIPSK